MAHPRRVRVTTASRLHFGMFSFGRPDVRQYGGVGVMIDEPRLVVEFAPHDTLEIVGPLKDEVESAVEHVIDAFGLRMHPDVRIEVLEAPPRHVGLGSGTQLGLAVAAGVNAACETHRRPEHELARAGRRGLRSAIGVHGFAQGGLLVEAGKFVPSEISPLVTRAALPAEWRFVLIRPTGEVGLSGDVERSTFAALPPVDDETTRELWRIALAELLPTVARRDCAAFGAALDRFGRLAGECFSTAQGGVFSSSRVAALAEAARQAGAAGVAQSSWGPTIAAVVESQAEAERLAERVEAKDIATTITAPCNRGARIEVR